MISNERTSYGQRTPHGQPSGPRPQVNEDTLKRDEIQVERKKFIFTLKENARGRFLRITEDVNGRRDNIIIPAPGLAEFQRVLQEMIQTAEAAPPKPEAAE